MLALNNLQLEGFQKAVDWKAGFKLPDGRILGVARKGDADAISQGFDFRVEALANRVDLRDKTVMEVGSFESIHTIQLAGLCREVWALEVRPANIVCALTRLFVHDIHNVKLFMKDVRDLDDSFGRPDAIFHAGVLYHLLDPVSHLFVLGKLTDTLLLDTHFCNEDSSFARSDIAHEGEVYKAFTYAELGWENVFSGVESASRWLLRADLLRALRDAGFDNLEVTSERIERNGPRMTIFARKSTVLR